MLPARRKHWVNICGKFMRRSEWVWKWEFLRGKLQRVVQCKQEAGRGLGQGHAKGHTLAHNANM